VRKFVRCVGDGTAPAAAGSLADGMYAALDSSDPAALRDALRNVQRAVTGSGV